MTRHAFTALCLIVLVAGCQATDQVFRPIASGNTVFSATPLTQNNVDAPIDLPTLIDPTVDSAAEVQPGGLHSAFNPIPVYSYPRSDAPYEQRLNAALANFHGLDAATQKVRRSQVQEALLDKSTTLCNLYKATLLQTGAQHNLILGDTTTLLAGLAAAFTQLATIRPLIAGAGIASAWRSEYTADVFANLNLQVITAGIEKRRSEYYSAILKARSCSAQDYPLEEAVKDAVTFHAYCSLYAGLEEASLSIKQAQSPGLDELTATLSRLGALNATLQKALSGIATPTPPSTPTVSFSVTPGSQAVGNCQLPVPGAPKSSATASGPVVIQTLRGPVPMAFSDPQDPLTALASANNTVTTTYTNLSAQLNKAKLTQASQALDAALKTFNAATDPTGALKTPDGTTPQQASSNYYSAVENLQQCKPGDSADQFATAQAKVNVAQQVNTTLSNQIQAALSAFMAAAAQAQSALAAAQPPAGG